jgi:hypothetical protein
MKLVESLVRSSMLEVALANHSRMEMLSVDLLDDHWDSSD